VLFSLLFVSRRPERGGAFFLEGQPMENRTDLLRNSGINLLMGARQNAISSQYPGLDEDIFE
jgi:hypothetical protein